MISFQQIIESIKEFEQESSSLLGNSEEAVLTRAYNAKHALEKVAKLSVVQTDLLKQAVRCIEHEIYRASIVMSWAAVADLVLDKCVKNSAGILAIRARWNFSDKTSLAETQGDYSIIEALKQAKFISKGEMKSLHGMLHRRNECAHPSSFFPGPNEALGYIDESIAMIKKL